MQAYSTMILPTQKRSADGRIGRSPIPDPSRARRRGTGSCAARADTPWSAWRGPGSSAGSLTAPEKRAILPERACPERARRRLILDRARSVALPAASSFTPSPGRGSPASPAPPTGGAGSTTWGPAGPDADPCGDAPSRPGPRRLRPDPRVHAPPPRPPPSRAEPTRQTRPSCPASRTKHGPAPPTPPNSTPMPQDAPLRTGHDQRAPQTRPVSPAARRPRHRHPPAGSAPPNTSTHTRRPICVSPDTHH